MNIVVCLKQVPGTTEVKIDPQTNTLIRQGIENIINPFDTYAIEEGVRLKEKDGGNVSVITMGPSQAEAALREAISLGVDEAVLLSDRAFAGADTWATAFLRVRRMVEEGHEIIETTLPAVITVAKEINVPRLPSLRGIMKSKSARIDTWGIQELGVDEGMVGLAGSSTQVIKVFFPQRVHQAEMLEGTPEKQVDTLIDRLKSAGLC